MEFKTRLQIYAIIFCILIISLLSLRGFTNFRFDTMSAGDVTYETTNPVLSTIFAIIAIICGGLLIISLILEIIYKFKKIKSFDKE